MKAFRPRGRRLPDVWALELTLQRNQLLRRWEISRQIMGVQKHKELRTYRYCLIHCFCYYLAFLDSQLFQRLIGMQILVSRILSEPSLVQFSPEVSVVAVAIADGLVVGKVRLEELGLLLGGPSWWTWSSSHLGLCGATLMENWWDSREVEGPGRRTVRRMSNIFVLLLELGRQPLVLRIKTCKFWPRPLANQIQSAPPSALWRISWEGREYGWCLQIESSTYYIEIFRCYDKSLCCINCVPLAGKVHGDKIEGQFLDVP